MPNNLVTFPKWSPIISLVALSLLTACSGTKNSAVAVPQPDKPVREIVVPLASASDKHISAVRLSAMDGYRMATIGNAFEAAFSDSRWSSSESNTGVWVVEYTGLLPTKVFKGCLPAKKTRPADTCAENGKVTFRWTFASGGQSFFLDYIDRAPWPSGSRSTRNILSFIYEPKESTGTKKISNITPSFQRDFRYL